MKQRPAIGVALIVRKAGKILLHKRKGRHCPNTWACPGGHLEMWEELPETALRELKEEAGNIQVTPPTFLTVSNCRHYDEKKHYLTVFMLSDWISGEAKVMEPKKCERWEWFDFDHLPAPLMLGIEDIKSRGCLLQAIMGEK